MPAAESPAHTYLLLRQAELAAQRALLIAGIPLTLIQPHFDQKLAEAYQRMQQHPSQS